MQIAGMNPHEKLPEGDPGSYANKTRAETAFATSAAASMIGPAPPQHADAALQV